jgi:hypothetical protein
MVYGWFYTAAFLCDRVRDGATCVPTVVSAAVVDYILALGAQQDRLVQTAHEVARECSRNGPHKKRQGDIAKKKKNKTKLEGKEEEQIEPASWSSRNPVSKV